MKISIVSPAGPFQPRIDYVIQFLNNHPLTPPNCRFFNKPQPGALSLHYSIHPADKAPWIPKQSVIFSTEILPTGKLVANAYKESGKLIYSVETVPKKDQIFFRDDKFRFDWLETLFFHLSRYEEYHCPEKLKDQWGMMWEREQFLVTNQIHRIPVVDHLVWAILKSVGELPVVKKTEVSWTHDLDAIIKYKNPYRVGRALGRSLLDGNSPRRTFQILQRASRILVGMDKDPFYNFDWFLLKDVRLEAPDKILFVMTGGNTKHDRFYDIGDVRFREILSIAKDRGYSIGIHPSYNSPDKADMYLAEKETLEKVVGKKVVHSRQHFLRFCFKSTPAIIEQSGIKWDSTLGYQRMIGFRCGTGFAYNLYDFQKERPFSFKELPLVVMDGALMNECGDEIDRIESYLNAFLAANKTGTHLTFNFHNSIFDPDKRNAEELKKLYLQIGMDAMNPES